MQRRARKQTHGGVESQRSQKEGDSGLISQEKDVGSLKFSFITCVEFSIPCRHIIIALNTTFGNLNE